MEFISKLVESLAWPLVLILIAFKFKDSFSSLLESLSKLKSGDFELEFEKSATEIEEVSEDVFGPETDNFEPTINKLESSPRTVIIEYWIKVISTAKNLRDTQYKDVPLKNDSPLEINRFLDNSHILNSKGMKIFHELRKIRNIATHEPDSAISIDQATYFAKQANRLIHYFQNYTKPAQQNTANR